SEPCRESGLPIIRCPNTTTSEYRKCSVSFGILPEDAEDAAVFVRPRGHGWGARVIGGPVFNHRPIGDEELRRGVGRGVDDLDGTALVAGGGLYDAGDVEVAIGDVDEQKAAGLEAVEVQAKGFAREKVDGDGVARKSVEHERVETGGGSARD